MRITRLRHAFVPAVAVLVSSLGIGPSCLGMEAPPPGATAYPATPVAEKIFLRALPRQPGKALVIVEFAKGQKLPVQLSLSLEKEPILLRDDGQEGDVKPGDGRYSAVIPFEFPAKMASPDKPRAASDEGHGKATRPVFNLREKVGTQPTATLDRAAFESGKEIELAPDTAPSAPLIPSSLMIVDQNVVNDPRASAGGKWSFGYLMRNLAAQGGVDPSLFARRWTQHWELPQMVNGFPAAARASGIQQKVLANWPKNADGTLDLDKAPFRLCAIVNRIDLRGDILLGGSHSAGEARMVFCAVDGSGGKLAFTVIFEFGIRGKDATQVKAWGQKWADLRLSALGSPDYNNALEAITEEFVHSSADPNQNGLDQLRTNEIELGNPWQLREFKISPSGSDDAGFLREVTVKQNPDLSVNNNAVLLAWINGNAADVLQSRAIVPRELPVLGQVLGAASDEGGAVWFQGTPPATKSLRHLFGLQTCNGCHTNETGTPFTHVAPRNATETSGLSGFLKGIVVPDPNDATLSRTFADLTRRADDLDDLINLPLIFQLKHQPLRMTH